MATPPPPPYPRTVGICHVCDRPVNVHQQGDNEEFPHEPSVTLKVAPEGLASRDRQDPLNVQPQGSDPFHRRDQYQPFEGVLSEPHDRQRISSVWEVLALVWWALVMVVGLLVSAACAAGTLLGFETKGIASGSWAAMMQGPHVRCGSWFAVMQSWGAKGLFVTGMTYGSGLTVIGLSMVLSVLCVQQHRCSCAKQMSSPQPRRKYRLSTAAIRRCSAKSLCRKDQYMK